MRLFFAITCPAPLARRISFDVAPMRAAAPSVAWVPETAYHVTVKFVGERAEAEALVLAQAARRVASRSAPLSLHLEGTGAFPNLRRPRVVYVSMRHAGSLQTLASELDTALSAVGVACESRLFRAHLTVGRMKRELPGQERLALEAAAKECRPAGEWRVRSLDLMRSTLSAQGASYSLVSACPLGKA